PRPTLPSQSLNPTFPRLDLAAAPTPRSALAAAPLPRAPPCPVAAAARGPSRRHRGLPSPQPLAAGGLARGIPSPRGAAPPWHPLTARSASSAAAEPPRRAAGGAATRCRRPTSLAPGLPRRPAFRISRPPAAPTRPRAAWPPKPPSLPRRRPPPGLPRWQTPPGLPPPRRRPPSTPVPSAGTCSLHRTRADPFYGECTDFNIKLGPYFRQGRKEDDRGRVRVTACFPTVSCGKLRCCVFGLRPVWSVPLERICNHLMYKCGYHTPGNGNKAHFSPV
ncbi:hypothetical protein U9M48_002432, partial [Paspalum notatum var. saurae]